MRLRHRGVEQHNVYRRDVTLIQDLPELDTFSPEFQADPHGLLRDALARGTAYSEGHSGIETLFTMRPPRR